MIKQSTHIDVKELKNPIVLIGLGLGSGLAPKAPGTMGTLLAVPLYLSIQDLSFTFYAAITLAITVMGVWICSYTAKKLGVHDHPAIVIDEIAGFLITMFAVPAGWQWLLAGFVLFRVLDILKPWPISWMDKNIGGGLGIMLDDIAAGLCAVTLIHGYIYASGLV